MLTKIERTEYRYPAAQKVRSLLESSCPVFDTKSLGRLWDLGEASIRVEVFRLVKSGLLKRLGRGLYSLAERDPLDFEVANALYQPSVVSSESALNYWGGLIQVPQVVSSVATRSFNRTIRGTTFQFRRLPARLVTVGSVKEKGFFLANIEKSLLDYLYFGAKGLGAVEVDSLSLPTTMKWAFVDEYLATYPARSVPVMRAWVVEIKKRGARGNR